MQPLEEILPKICEINFLFTIVFSWTSSPLSGYYVDCNWSIILNDNVKVKYQ